MVAEIQKPGYSRAEKHQMDSLLRDPARVRAASRVIGTMLKLREESPDAYTTWEAYTSAHPLPDVLEGSKELFETAFNRFRAARNAVTHFASVPKEEVDSQVRSLFDIRNGAAVSISFGVDYAVITMQPEEIHRVWLGLQQHSGSAVPKGSTTLGFISHNRFLQTQDGNACPVIIVPPAASSGRSTLLHEAQHVVTNLYVLRNMFSEKDDPADKSVREQYRGRVRAILSGLEKKTPEAIAHRLERVLFRVLASSRKTYFNELASVAAEEDFDFTGKAFMSITGGFEVTSADFKGARRSYGKRIEEVMDGILDALDSTDIPEAEKRRITVKLETQLATFILQNYQVGHAIAVILGNPQQDRYAYYGSLYAVGPVRPEVLDWTQGYDVDIPAVRRQLRRPQEYDDRGEIATHVLHRVITRSMAQFPNDKIEAAKEQCIVEAKRNISQLFDPTEEDSSQYFEGQEFEKRVRALFAPERSSFFALHSELTGQLAKRLAAHMAYIPSASSSEERLISGAINHYFNQERFTIALYQRLFTSYLRHRGYSEMDIATISENFSRATAPIRIQQDADVYRVVRELI